MYEIANQDKCTPDSWLRECIYFFFFSSRRRHTRLQGDWSSDVCSSDLPRRGELAELVADHLLADENGHMLAAVVDGDRVTDHFREDRRGPRPGADHLLARSEEHTSELQSPCNLVCRLLLEKKKDILVTDFPEEAIVRIEPDLRMQAMAVLEGKPHIQ